MNFSKNIRASLLFILVVSVLSGCKKYKKTTPVRFSIHTSTTTDSNDYLECKGGIFSITGMEFSGKREKGADVNFYRDLSENMIFGEYYSNESLDFDLPQGNYTNLSLTLHFHGTDGAKLIKGLYESSNGPTVPFIVQIEDDISIKAENSSFSKIWTKTDPRVTFEFSGVNWFEGVPKGHFQSAYVHDIVQQNQDAIYITSTINQNIYEKVIENIAKASQLTVE